MMDTIQTTVADTTSAMATQTASHGINLWMIIALVELVIIIVLLLSRCARGGSSRSDIKRKVMAEGEVDFGNIMNSSFNAEKVYKELLIKCHPDRFAPDEAKMAIANDLSTLITKHKHDIKRLNELKMEAKAKLNINI